MTPEQSTQALSGGKTIQVAFRDGHLESILVRELPVSLLPSYGQMLLSDEAGTVEMYCGRPPGWSDTITRASFLEIIQTGEELNLPFFAELQRLKIKRAEAVFPQVSGLQSELVRALASAASPTSSPNSAPAQG